MSQFYHIFMMIGPRGFEQEDCDGTGLQGCGQARVRAPHGRNCLRHDGGGHGLPVAVREDGRAQRAQPVRGFGHRRPVDCLGLPGTGSTGRLPRLTRTIRRSIYRYSGFHLHRALPVLTPLFRQIRVIELDLRHVLTS